MRQLVVAAADMHGRFLAINALSKAAAAAGLTESNIIGTRLWDYGSPSDARLIRSQFASCLIDETVAKYRTTSEIGGVTEVWQTVLVPASGTHVMAVAREVFPKRTIRTSRVELSILEMLANDKTIEEIAAHLNATGNAVTKHIQRLHEKCGVHTTHGLIAWCLRYGVL